MPKKRKKVKAILYEDGSVSVAGPGGRMGVPNVGEGGTSRGGYGTVRQFGPTTSKAGVKRDPRRKPRASSTEAKRSVASKKAKAKNTKYRMVKTTRKRN